MKKILSITLAILLIAGVAYALTPGKAVLNDNQPTSGYKQGHDAGDIMGQGRYPSDPHKTFRFVRYIPPGTLNTTLGDNTAWLDYCVSAGMAVIWDTDVSGDDGVSVSISSLSQDTRIAGILATDALPPVSTDIVSAATSDVGKRNWAWVQTFGKAEAYFAGSGANAAAGYGWGTSVITGEIDVYHVTGDVAAPWVLSEAAFSDHLGLGGFFEDASSTAHGTAGVFIRCE